MGKLWTLHIDGAARNNPGPAGAGFVLHRGEELVIEAGFYLEEKTNNQAEYLALLIGLFHVKQLLDCDDSLLIVSDSQLLVRQMIGQYKVKNGGLLPLKFLASSELTTVSHSFKHVLRSENKKADRMANEGIDRQIPLPPEFLKFLHHEQDSTGIC